MWLGRAGRCPAQAPCPAAGSQGCSQALSCLRTLVVRNAEEALEKLSSYTNPEQTAL